MRSSLISVAAFAATLSIADTAVAQGIVGPCGNKPCQTVAARVRAISIFPPPELFSVVGQRYDRAIDLGFAANTSVRVDLGFSVNFGGFTTNAVNVFENGYVTLATPNTLSALAVAQAFAPVDSLTALGSNVIAPFYANLAVGRGSGDTRIGIGDVVVQYGSADPYANEEDGNLFVEGDSRQAVSITWNGLQPVGGAELRAAGDGLVYTSLLITQQNRTDANFEFLYGQDPLKPFQEGFDSIAGFSLGRTSLQFRGPYQQGIPNFFEFRNGVFVGQGATVPEPAIWLQMIFGFGLIGGLLRAAARSRRRAHCHAELVSASSAARTTAVG